jgi:hypothetical protein
MRLPAIGPRQFRIIDRVSNPPTPNLKFWVLAHLPQTLDSQDAFQAKRRFARCPDRTAITLSPAASSSNDETGMPDAY